MPSFISDENAVNIQIGYILNLIVLMIITGIIIGSFYLYTEASSEKAMSAGFTDLGNQIARDITNMYFISENSKGHVTITSTHNIPLAMGGNSYVIKLNNASDDRMASVDISKDSFAEYNISTTLNSIGKPVYIYTNRSVYSSSGEITIRMDKNSNGWSLWIE
ncbi:MAG: hypothetical protein J5U19_07620 [Candidatus Methanoperedens sp.]|nr:hypothetical protein [Candidatus Methanoperedens sp.]MCE8428237.1 hypothetical protein [Candidatus Methanoperedens sp.]